MNTTRIQTDWIPRIGRGTRVSECDVHPSRDPSTLLASLCPERVSCTMIQVMQVIQVLDCEKSQRMESY